MNKLGELLAYQSKEEEIRKIKQNIMNNEDYKKYIQARKALEQTPESLSALDKKATKYHDEFANMQDKLTTLYENLSEFEENNLLSTELSSNEQKYYDNTIKKNLDNLKTLKQEYKKFEEMICATEKEYKSLAKMHKDMQKQRDTYKDKYTELTKEYQDSIATLEKELKTLESKLANENDFKKYKTKREEKLFPVICSVEDNRCSCCKMQLSLDILNKIEQGVECENCGRILYKK